MHSVQVHRHTSAKHSACQPFSRQGYMIRQHLATPQRASLPQQPTRGLPLTMVEPQDLRGASVMPQAMAGDGAGSLVGGKGDAWDGGRGGSGGSSGGGHGNSGRGSGGDGSGDGRQQPNHASWVWQGWAERVAADPEFPFKVLLEQVIGVGASVIGDMSSRPNWGLHELDFVFATLVVGSIVNFSLMYLLAPTAAAGAAAAGTAAAKQSLLVRALSSEFLVKWGAPGANMFQSGFSLDKRLINFAYKGTIFAAIGMAAGTVGTAVSNGLLALRKQLDPTFTTQNEPPTVLGNAACWALHMGISSNLRYQMLGGIDGVLVKAMPSSLFRGYSAVIRGLNNIVGGISFVTIARLFGVQKSGTSDQQANAVA